MGILSVNTGKYEEYSLRGKGEGLPVQVFVDLRVMTKAEVIFP